MDNLARKYRAHPQLEYATVRELQDAEQGMFLLELQEGAAITARQSASCLLLPEPGDEVLVSLDEQERCFILNVLTRADPEGEQQLTFKGGLSLQVENGGLRLMAEEDVTLAAGEQCACIGKKVSVLADEASLRSGHTHLLSGVLEAQLKTVRCVADTVETSARRLTQRLRDLFCFVEEQSDFQSGNERHVVQETLTMHAKNAFHVADEIVKVDGEQVHLG